VVASVGISIDTLQGIPPLSEIFCVVLPVQFPVWHHPHNRSGLPNIERLSARILIEHGAKPFWIAEIERVPGFSYAFDLDKPYLIVDVSVVPPFEQRL